MMRIGELCAGYGGLGMGVQSVIDARMAWCADNDLGASKILAHHWPTVPNHGDLTTTDWATVEPVDIITAGWPCQPWSLAGKGRGKDDERAIWPAIADAVRHLRPRYVILENVAAVVVLGELARAVGDLANLGYVGSWRCLRGSDAGAPHGRNRCFIAATDPKSHTRWLSNGDGQLAPHTADLGYQRARQSWNGWPGPEDSGSVAPNPTGDGRDEGWPEPAGQLRRPDAAERGGAADPHTVGVRRGATGRDDRLRVEGLVAGDIAWGQYEPAIRRWESVLGRCAPAPTEPGRTGNPRLSARFVEWMQGLPAGHVTEVPGLSRNEQLKALGNGVVPQQCAAALRMLLNAEEVAA